MRRCSVGPGFDPTQWPRERSLGRAVVQLSQNRHNVEPRIAEGESEHRAEEAQSMANEPLVESDSGAQSDAPIEKDLGTEDDRVRERAYHIWVDEGHPEGRELDHWLRAKSEVEGAPYP
jgi:hypothetical protein